MQLRVSHFRPAVTVSFDDPQFLTFREGRSRFPATPAGLHLHLSLQRGLFVVGICFLDLRVPNPDFLILLFLLVLVGIGRYCIGALDIGRILEPGTRQFLLDGFDRFLPRILLCGIDDELFIIYLDPETIPLTQVNGEIRIRRSVLLDLLDLDLRAVILQRHLVPLRDLLQDRFCGGAPVGVVLFPGREITV